MNSIMQVFRTRTPTLSQAQSPKGMPSIIQQFLLVVTTGAPSQQIHKLIMVLSFILHFIQLIPQDYNTA